MHGIELDRDAKVLDRFLQIPAFLQDLVTKAVASQKALGILGHHLPERIEIHQSLRNRFKTSGILASFETVRPDQEGRWLLPSPSVRLPSDSAQRSRNGTARRLRPTRSR